jgi:hypothetical protein
VPDHHNRRKFTAIASNGHIDWLYFDGVLDASNNTYFPSQNFSRGWVLHISDKDHLGGEKRDAIQICSNANCDLNTPITVTDKTVYITIRHDSRLDTTDKKHPKFWDSECDSGPTPRPCEFLLRVTLESLDINTVGHQMVGDCGVGTAPGPGKCQMGIGAPVLLASRKQ